MGNPLANPLQNNLHPQLSLLITISPLSHHNELKADRSSQQHPLCYSTALPSSSLQMWWFRSSQKAIPPPGFTAPSKRAILHLLEGLAFVLLVMLPTHKDETYFWAIHNSPSKTFQKRKARQGSWFPCKIPACPPAYRCQYFLFLLVMTSYKLPSTDASLCKSV